VTHRAVIAEPSASSRSATSALPRLARFADLAAAAGFLAIAVLFWWPLPARPGTVMFAQPFGDPVLNAWILAWGADRALHAFRGFWTGLFYYPYPDTVAYSEHLLGITLFTAPIQWVTGNPVLAYNLATLASTALAGFGAYLLARDLTGRRDAALVAGAAFACSPFRAPHMFHLQVLMSGWMPLGLWALHRFFSTGSRRALAGFAACFVLQAWSNGYYLYFMAVATAIVALHGVWLRRRWLGPTIVALAVSALAIAAALAPIAAAYLRARREQGLERSVGDMAAFSATLLSYLRADHRLPLWGHVIPTGLFERQLFPGLLVTLLASAALVGWLTRRRWPTPPPVVHRLWAVPLYTVVLVVAFVCSLGPSPRIGSFTPPFPGPYAWLLALVPGFTGLRVPARFAVVVTLALAVLAACGFARLTAGLRPAWRRAASVCAMGMLVAEGYLGPIGVRPFPPPDMAAERPAYEWLRAQPDGAALELPVGDVRLQTRYLYNTLVHRHRIVNGYSGYGSLLQDLMGGPPFLELARLDDALDMARALRLQWILVHPPLFPDPAFAETLVAALRDSPRVARVVSFDRVTIAELRPLAVPPVVPFDPAWRAIAPDAFTASASHNQAALVRAFDGIVGSRWLTGERQQGREWIELRFADVTNVARVRLDMDRRSFSDYPRGLAVESSSDGREWRQLFAGGVLPQLALSVIREPRTPGIDIVLPPNESRLLRLRTLGTTHRWYWSVHELRVWRR
jgi:hypothetical protein